LKTAKKPKNICPYWDQITKQDCRLTKGGLYIPLPEHIEIFCSTTHFNQCHQFIRGCELLREAAASDSIYADSDSRRRHRRIKDQLSVSIATCDSFGQATGKLAEDTTTIDLSIGGMCVKSRKEISSNELLLLKIKDEDSKSSLSGIGEVRWCKTAKESSDYLVGIAFKTKETGRAIGRHLGLAAA
jgi:hypothetical protein